MAKTKRVDQVGAAQKLVDEVLNDSSEKSSRLRSLREKIKERLDPEEPKTDAAFAAIALAHGHR